MTQSYKKIPTESTLSAVDIISEATNENTTLPAKVKSPGILDPDIIDSLPSILREGVQRLVEPNDKQVFLVTSLAVLSGVLPKVKGIYDGKVLRPNLYAFIVGGYGTGKGAMSYSYELIRKIEDEKTENTKEELNKWKAEPKDTREDLPPIREGLIIPANASSSAFLETLDDYGHSGILFETEGDTLAQTLLSDHGNYSDHLRKAFHHEPLSMTRRANKELRKIPEPKLSVVLAGTPDQFKRLVPDAKNGLFSRFLYLNIDPEREFRNVFDSAKSNYLDEIGKLGDKVYALYKTLDQDSLPEVEFTLSEVQKVDFVRNYRELRSGFIEDTSEDAAGVFNRLAVINFRLAMILSVLRVYDEQGNVPPKIVCSNTDYEAALFFTNILTEECKRMYFSLPETEDPENFFFDDENLSENEKAEINAVIKLKINGLSIRKIAAQSNMSKSTVHRIINKYRPRLGQAGTG